MKKLSPRPALLAANFHAQLLGGGPILPQRVMGEQTQDAYEEAHVAILNIRANEVNAINKIYNRNKVCTGHRCQILVLDNEKLLL